MKKLILTLCLFVPLLTFAQDDLESLLNEISADSARRNYVTSAYKSTHVINMQSTELKAPGSLEFRISHRFGPVNGGAYQLFGLDQATIRLSFEYGFNDWISAGFGRSTYEKTYDFFSKFALLKQQTGKVNMPISLLYYIDMAINGLRNEDPTREYAFSTRMSYVHQLIIGRKFSDRASLLFSPTLVHKNLVATTDDQNITYALGFAGRLKISNRVALTTEYIYRVPPSEEPPSYTNFHDSFSVGVDIETGGHVFQIHLSNSLPMFDRAFITETNQRWEDGGVHLGFNITRDFQLKK
ncbi:DUF5777 family beta-barrel protein [Flammeovirgaceae bacterium SG7u.111]|nr:DUF5777 family beta-barrel protein [Flammeovirgaceae bacterium SG7u.132]WPO38592.1 DUF5777 family beta-barrel protein [Flammeovirgaceae bacterium SG7u.111]